MPKNLTRRRRARNDAPLPLFEWADSVQRRALPRAAAHVQRLCNVSPSVARLYAELAGLNLEDRT